MQFREHGFPSNTAVFPDRGGLHIIRPLLIVLVLTPLGNQRQSWLIYPPTLTATPSASISASNTEFSGYDTAVTLPDCSRPPQHGRSQTPGEDGRSTGVGRMRKAETSTISSASRMGIMQMAGYPRFPASRESKFSRCGSLRGRVASLMGLQVVPRRDPPVSLLRPPARLCRTERHGCRQLRLWWRHLAPARQSECRKVYNFG
jgi:hypothetical protein